MGVLSETQVEILRSGVDLKGGLGASQPCTVDVTSVQRKTTTLHITLREGKNRQVRRMLHEVGSGVISLKRLR